MEGPRGERPGMEAMLKGTKVLLLFTCELGGLLCVYLILRPFLLFSSSSGQDVIIPSKRSPFAVALTDFKEYEKVRLSQVCLAVHCWQSVPAPALTHSRATRHPLNTV